MDSINGLATIMSEKVFKSKYPKGTIPRKSKDYGNTFVCRRGVNLKTSIYTDEMQWEDVKHSSTEEVHQLIDLLEQSTTTTRKRKFDKTPKKDPTFKRGFVEEEYDSEIGSDTPNTPRKKRKTSAASTPRKPKTPSKLLTPRHKR